METCSIEAVISALNQAKVRYLIAGGLAVNAHGYVRFTIDLDLVIQLESANIQAAWEALRGLGYQARVPITAQQFADANLREKWQKEKGMLVLQFWSDEHRRTPVDIFVQEPFEFDQEYASAELHEIAPNLKAKVVTKSTLVRMKKEAARPKDLLDLEMLGKIEETQ
ncbi:MAG: hypothetical protein NTZ01_00575 [Verrucomicrobia bacterium]|nr:hypothetical protein [Verrucomicrobiota bacterium]